MTEMGTRRAAEYLEVDRTTIYRLLAKGKIQGKKVKGRWRFSKADVQRAMVQREIDARRFSNCSCI
jgi:excisionase family DNA binding protein